MLTQASAFRRLPRDVSLTLSKEAQAKLPDNLKFDHERLPATIRRVLDAKGLLAKSPDATLPKIEIVIGQDGSRMGWLYKTFAQHTIEELTGTKKE